MKSLAHNLSLYANNYSPFDTTISQALNFFEGNAFSTWKEIKESENKINIAIINRLNEVIKAIGILARITSKKI